MVLKEEPRVKEVSHRYFAEQDLSAARQMHEVVVHELEREKPEEKCCNEDRCRDTEHHDATAPIRRDSHNASS